MTMVMTAPEMDSHKWSGCVVNRAGDIINWCWNHHYGWSCNNLWIYHRCRINDRLLVNHRSHRLRHIINWWCLIDWHGFHRFRDDGYCRNSR